MKLIFNCLFFSLICVHATSQSIKGTFPPLKGTILKLGVFNGFRSEIIDSLVIDKTGGFSFEFSEGISSVGFLINAENKPFLVILDKNEDIVLTGENLSSTSTLKVLSGKQNLLFEKYAIEHPKRDQVLKVWQFLNGIYLNEDLFLDDKKTRKFILKQTEKIKKEDQNFFRYVDSESYISWYLPFRKFLNEINQIAQHNPHKIPIMIDSLRSLDYSDERLYKSGLLKDVIDAQFWLLENSGKPFKTIFNEMKISIDSIISNLTTDETKFNEITEYMFFLFEKHSLFDASEYLALKALSESGCILNNKLTFELESYRSTARGKIAPDFHFSPITKFSISANEIKPIKLSDLKSKYYLIIFGSSDCPKCINEIPLINKYYSKWKSKGIEVIYVSLDDDADKHTNFIKSFQFNSIIDFEKWEGEIVKSYFVSGTPTLFLLSENLEIILKPHSVSQLDSWININML
jgi:thiol-disulfide isomerase/thioredoxin